MDAPDLYELRPLLYPALPVDANVNPASPAALGRSLRSAEPFRNHLYLGSTDGHVFCLVQPLPDEDAASEGEATGEQDFRHVGTRSISSKPIERILILPALELAIVQSEATLTFHELPSFLPIPQQVLPHIKGVATVALDDQELFCTSNGLDDEGLASLCIVKRKSIMLVKLSKDTWRPLKEIPLPGGATNARRFGDWLCISTTSDYNVVNLKEATLSPVGLPISQTTDAPSASSRPSIVSIPISKHPPRCEFLITSHSEEVTLGVFISQEGEPTARLIEWPSHPRMLASDFPHLHALLRNDTIEVHNLDSVEKVQTVHLPSPLEPRTLSNATSQLELVEESEQTGMSDLKVRLGAGGTRRRISEQETSSWRSKAMEARRARSNVLMVGKNVIQGMFRARILSSAIRALHRGDLNRARKLADAAWEQRTAYDERSLEFLELEYVNQLLAFKCLALLQIEDAQTYMQRGRLDYRIFFSLFPSVSANVFDGAEGEDLDVFANVADAIDEIDNLETFPAKNIEANYCPPLQLSNHPALIKLHDALSKRVASLFDKMLETYRNDEDLVGSSARTTLNTIYAQSLIKKGDGDALSTFLERHLSSVRMDTIEPQLAKVGCYAVLARIYEDRKDWSAVLDLQTRLLDGELTDDHFNGTTQGVADLLQRCEDAELVHKYSIWLVQRGVQAGVKMLTKGRAGTSGRSDQETLQELRAIDQKAATAFLEAIALTRKHQDSQAHKELVTFLLDSIQTALRDPEQQRAMQGITDDFIEGAYAESFVSHLALYASADSACAGAIVDRLKLMALLQGSSAIDVDWLIDRLKDEPLLSYERAILSGKKGHDDEALTLLAISLRDANSAETYCSQDRRPLSLLVLQNADVEDLKVYCQFVSRSLRRSATSANGETDVARTKTDQLSLLKALLNVYMRAGEGNDFRVATTHLLNTQAMHLSTQDILSTVPAHWSVQTLETFLSRSIRRELHRANEGHIQRATALAQNLEIAETLWAKRRGLGGVIEDGTEDADGAAEREAQDDEQDYLAQTLVEKAERLEEKIHVQQEQPRKDEVDVDSADEYSR